MHTFILYSLIVKERKQEEREKEKETKLGVLMVRSFDILHLFFSFNKQNCNLKPPKVDHKHRCFVENIVSKDNKQPRSVHFTADTQIVEKYTEKIR